MSIVKTFGSRTLAFVVIFLVQVSVFAQVRVPFAERPSQSNPSRKTFNIKGDFALIGNTNLSLANYADDLMNDNLLLYVDIDDKPSTINSSSATLVFPRENGADPSCTNVLFAGLYWSGRGPTEDVFYVNDQNGFPKKLDRREVTLFGPNDLLGGKFRAGENDIRYTYGLDLDNDLGLFVGFVEVTDYVRKHGEGEYTVADLAALEGTNYHYGGWSLVVVYENPAMDNRAITVFDGYAFVRGSVVADFTIPISGFSAVDTGPVNMKIGVAAGEGDVAAFGDYFEIERGVNSDDFVKLSHAGNTEFNFFNSSISTGGNARKPNLKNNTGMDIAVFDIPNPANSVIANGQTSTRFRYGTDGDAYVIFNIVMAVDANEPEVSGFHTIKSVNRQPYAEGQVFKPGDEVELEVEVRNVGGVALQDVMLGLHIPEGLQYLASSGDYFFQGNTGKQPSITSGKLLWEMGDIPLPANADQVMAKLSYTVEVTESCSALLATCGGDFVLDGEIDGVNATTGSPIPTSPLTVGLSESGNCVDVPIFGPIELVVDADDFLQSTCGYYAGEAKIKLCVRPEESEVLPYYVELLFPQGTRFFNEYPMTSQTIEYGGGVNFPKDFAKVYYAVTPESECPIGFGFLRSEVEMIVDVEDAFCESSGSERVVSLTPSGGVPPYTVFWGNDAEPTGELTRSLAPGIHWAKAIDQNGCESRQIEFEVPETGGFSLNVDKIGDSEECPEKSSTIVILSLEGSSSSAYEVQVEGVLSSGDPYLFSDPDFVGEKLELNDLPPGSYTVQVSNESSCSQFDYFEISEEEGGFLKVEFDYSSESLESENVLHYDVPVQFEDLSTGYVITDYRWDFGDGTTSAERSPRHKYAGPGVYTVTLSVSTDSGCAKEFSSVLMLVGSRFLRMPTAFTPDGDGRNDYYFPVFSQIVSLRLWLFNRWGETVFYSDRLDDKGWDGTLGGKEAPSGTYVYRIEYLEDTYSAKPINESGSFVLLK